MNAPFSMQRRWILEAADLLNNNPKSPIGLACIRSAHNSEYPEVRNTAKAIDALIRADEDEHDNVIYMTRADLRGGMGTVA